MVFETYTGGREALPAFETTEAYGDGREAVIMSGGAVDDEWMEALEIEGGDEQWAWDA